MQKYIDSNGIGFVKDSFDDGIEFASDTARIYVNGSQRLRIDSSGNTLIGGTLPAALTSASTATARRRLHQR